MKHILYITSLVALVLIAPHITFGQLTTPSGDGGFTTPAGSENAVRVDNPLVADSVIQLFETILDVVLIFAVPIIVFFIIYAGFLYVTARGNENTIKQAHMALLYALIGGLLILGARVLIEVVSGTVDAFRD